MAVSLTFSRQGSINANNKPQLSLAVTQAEVIPEHIFVFKVDDRGAEHDTYVSVTTLTELDTTPSTRVGVGQGNLYRKSAVDIEFTTAESAVRGIAEVDTAIRDLFNSYKLFIASINFSDTVELT